jgi:uncharacterized OB-fold protein
MGDILVKEELIQPGMDDKDTARLIGSKCKVCGYCCFPPKQVCIKCLCDDCMENINIGPQATLESFAVMHIGTPDVPAPYIMAYVKTPQGPSIFTLITGCEARDDALIIGQKMELVIEKIKQDEKGNNLLCWKFRPVKGDH